MNIVIPLIRSKWENEILYSLRSWYFNYQGDMQVHIVGDWCPEWLNLDKVNYEFIESKFTTTEQNLSKVFDFCMNNFDDFILTNDDIYILNKVSESDIKETLYLQDLSLVRNRLNNRWGRLLWKTAYILRENDLTIYNGECHTPYYYQSNKISEIYKEYGIDKGLGLLRTAYINNFIEHSKMEEMKTRKIGFYSRADSLRKLTFNEHYLNHYDNGLTDFLKKKIMGIFKERSPFEK